MTARRRVAPHKLKRTGETLTQQGVAVVERDFHNLAVGIRSIRRQRDRWRRKEGSFRSGCRQRDHRRIVPRIKPGQQLKIKAEVVADRRILMHLDCDDIQALHQSRRRDRGRVEDRAVIARRRARGQRRDRTIRHVEPRHIHAIHIHHRAVVPLHAEDEVCVVGRAGDIEVTAEIRRDVLRLRVPAKAHRGRLIPLAITELRRSAGPRAVVETQLRPVRPLVRAVIEIFPNGTSRDHRQRHRERHRTGGVVVARVVARVGDDSMHTSRDIRHQHAVRRRRVLTELHVIDEKFDVGDGTGRDRPQRGHRDGIGILEHGTVQRRRDRRTRREIQNPMNCRGPALPGGIQGHRREQVCPKRRLGDEERE